MSTVDIPVTLEQVNLNLLPALAALLRECNVSAAARTMRVSQSAMSHSLAKLRELLGDPLLVVSGRTMAATPRGLELAAALPPVMTALATALNPPRAFDPTVARRQFSIATLDYFEFATMPEVLAYLRDHAPGVGLNISRLEERSTDQLVAGEIDFIIAGESNAMPSSLFRRRLYKDPFVVMVRPDHPGVGRRLTLKQYTELDHILVSVEGRSEGFVDRILDKQGLSRQVTLRLPHFSCAALAVLHSDMVCTIASSVAHRAREVFGVRILAPPLELPAVGAMAWWPRQHHDDPARRWFRDVFFTGKALSPRIRKLMRAESNRLKPKTA